ncbi:MAG: ATP-binding protein, partial [Hyphomicrobium sp.]
IINDVLDLSKIEAGHLELEAVACDPGDVLDDVVGLFAGKAAAGGLELACRIAPDVPTSIITDPLRLRQILSNLVANALKFTEAGGVLVSLDMTETAGPGRHLRLTIADSGIGIPEDKIGQLFNPFTQADASTTRQFGGTGIGLTICRRLATAMGGRIEVSSVVGHGSTFAVTLPVTVAATREQCSKTDAYPRCAIVHSPGPYRDALMVLAARMQFDVVEPDALSNGDILFVGADLVARLASDETSRTLKRPHVVIVPRPSDTPAHIAAKHDGATRLLPPIGGRQSEAAIRRILSGVDQGDNGDALPRLTPAQDRASYSGRRVLAVDDNAINRELLAEALGRYGIAVISADSGAAALTCFEEGVFDLVFMDGSMPGMDGFETTRRIRAYERHQGGAETPIVALTANVLGQAADAWRSAGMSDYLAKPFTLATLDACLDRWLRAVANANPSSAVSSAPTVDTNQPLLDDSVLDMIASIQAPGDNLVDRVVGMYIDHAPRMLEALLACAAGEPEEIGKAAHALKSLSRNIGAVAVGEHCEHIEAGAADGYRPTSKALQ